MYIRSLKYFWHHAAFLIVRLSQYLSKQNKYSWLLFFFNYPWTHSHENLMSSQIQQWKRWATNEGNTGNMFPPGRKHVENDTMTTTTTNNNNDNNNHIFCKKC